MQRLKKGFTIIEILIVVSIIGILASVAFPAYDESRKKGRRTDGKSALLDLASKMEAYFYTNKTYTVDLTQLGYAAVPSTPEQHYTLGVNPSSAACPITSCYELQATAVGVQTSDGNLTLDSLGRKLPADKW